MSKAHVIVLSVVHQGMSKAEAARKFDVSWRWVHTLVTRYEAGGLDAVEQKNGHPLHPQTQGKIERFHQTLKLWLDKQPPAATITDLQVQLDRFRTIYNKQRPHRALNRQTPQQAYDATIKAIPATAAGSIHYRARSDIVDQFGKLTLRRAGRLHHLGVGRDHARKPVLILATEHDVTITDQNTGEVLSTHIIEPEKNYWRNQTKEPDRSPASNL